MPMMPRDLQTGCRRQDVIITMRAELPIPEGCLNGDM
jgi:hypothetical protein